MDSRPEGALGRALLASALVLGSLAGPAVAHPGSGATDFSVSHRQIHRRSVPIASHTDPVSAFAGVPAPAAQRGPTAASPPPPVSTTLAPTWCGDSGGRTTDDVDHESGNRGDAKIRVVYAYTSDQANRFAAFANMIQGDVKGMVEKIGGESGGTKGVRFDLGTACGPQYVDITTVALPQPESYYEVGTDDQLFRIKSDVSAALGPSPVKRDYLVFPDQIGTAGGGRAELAEDEQPGSENASNAGGMFAMTWYASYWSSTSVSVIAQRRDVHLHELGHNIGAVQANSPNHSSGHHCIDEWDVMCYDDDGSGSATVLTEPKPCSDGSAAAQYFDCNRDDYFNPSPPAGSYLATHWNTYNSVFLCPLSQCVPPAQSNGPGVSGTSSGSAPNQVTAAVTPDISLVGGSSASIRVGKGGAVALKQLLTCLGSGAACRVTTGLWVQRQRSRTAALAGVGRFAYTIPRGRSARVRARLSRRGRRLLHRRGRLRTQLHVAISRGRRTARFNIRLTIRAS
jgi:hypothetical protein